MSAPPKPTELVPWVSDRLSSRAHLPKFEKLIFYPLFLTKNPPFPPLLRAQGPKGAPAPGPVGGSICARATAQLHSVTPPLCASASLLLRVPFDASRQTPPKRAKPCHQSKCAKRSHRLPAPPAAPQKPTPRHNSTAPAQNEPRIQRAAITGITRPINRSRLPRTCACDSPAQRTSTFATSKGQR
jgi:hypothetical protein